MTSTAPPSLSVLGSFALHIDGREVTRLPRKAQALLTYLALQPDRRASREALADLLWTESGPGQSRHSLRQLLVALRRTPAGGLLRIDGDKLWIRSGAVVVDALALEAGLTDGSPDALARAATCDGGPLLGDFPPVSPGFEEWLLPQRARLAGVVARTLRRLAAAQVAAGALDTATGTAGRLVEMDALDESAHRLLIECLARAGQRAEALQQFERCVRTLREDLDVAPEPETMVLGERVRTGDGFPGPAGTARAVGAAGAVGTPPQSDRVAVPTAASTRLVVPANDINGPDTIALATAATRRRRPVVARFALVAGVVGLIVLSAGAFALWPSPRLSPGIAVARFHNVSGMTAQDPADAGVSDLVRLRLALGHHVRLVGDADAATGPAPSGAGADRPAVRSRYRLEGTAAFNTDAMHVTARLTDTGTELWSDNYERAASQVAQVADDIAARAVAQDRGLTVTAPQAPFADPRRVARELDALGYQTDYFRSIQDEGAQNLYRLALSFDPDDAGALTHLASSYIRLALATSPIDAAPLAQADANLSRAFLLDPRNAFVLFNACLLRRLQGRLSEAFALCRRSLNVDPRFPGALRELGHDLLEAGDGQQATSNYRAAIEAGPYLPLVYNAFKGLGVASVALGRRADAIVDFRKAIDLDAGNEDDEQLWLAATLEMDGRHTEAAQTLSAFMIRHPDLRVDGGYLRLLSAPAYADRREEVLKALASAVQVKQGLPAGQSVP
jgi:DNA-binding SARP family transcriptional activator/Tfp pilus assembly protein PilF/TolB-like protein